MKATLLAMLLLIGSVVFALLALVAYVLALVNIESWRAETFAHVGHGLALLGVFQAMMSLHARVGPGSPKD